MRIRSVAAASKTVKVGDCLRLHLQCEKKHRNNYPRLRFYFHGRFETPSLISSCPQSIHFTTWKLRPVIEVPPKVFLLLRLFTPLETTFLLLLSHFGQRS